MTVNVVYSSFRLKDRSQLTLNEGEILSEKSLVLTKEYERTILSWFQQFFKSRGSAETRYKKVLSGLLHVFPYNLC